MIAKRLTTLGACAGLVILFGWALEGWSKKAPPTPCPAGRFLVDPGSGQLVQGASTGSVDSVTLDAQGRISIGSGCLAVTGRITAKSHFTKLTATWASCGSALAARLKAKIVSPDCGVMTGRFKTKGGKPKPFTARRSTCGDGIVDGPGGEQCEPGVGGCASGIACTAACACESPPTTLAPPTTTVTSSTTTTLETTTTTVTSSTATTTVETTTTTVTSSITTTTLETTTTTVTSSTTTTLAPPTTTVTSSTATTTLETTTTTETSSTATTLETTTTTETSTTTTLETTTCGASAPTCNGTCASGQVCHLVPRLELCVCMTVGTTTTTMMPCQAIGGSQFHWICGGACPPGQYCGDYTIACGCMLY
jgi:hypothetical protein